MRFFKHPGDPDLPRPTTTIPLRPSDLVFAAETARVRWLKSKAPQPYERATYRDAIGISNANDIRYAQFGLAMSDEMSKYTPGKTRISGWAC
ncbi:hypothetical protein ACFXJ8_24265 [Nonomuraea sp. NPDC059194]|uniref:hypothetical protein n=1 Tax=Nonomuraea sp. NPDC059194 TaxID=3346764 RepID=UPI00369428F5